MIRQDDEFTPILLQSSDAGNEAIAKELKVGFINKNSKTLSLELREYIMEYFAFGNFVFIDPATGETIASVPDLKSLQQIIFDIPDESLTYHIERNHISKWLRARALFPLAELFRDFRPDDFTDLDEIRRFLSIH